MSIKGCANQKHSGGLPEQSSKLSSDDRLREYLTPHVKPTVLMRTKVARKCFRKKK